MASQGTPPFMSQQSADGEADRYLADLERAKQLSLESAKLEEMQREFNRECRGQLKSPTGANEAEDLIHFSAAEIQIRDIKRNLSESNFKTLEREFSSNFSDFDLLGSTVPPRWQVPGSDTNRASAKTGKVAILPLEESGETDSAGKMSPVHLTTNDEFSNLFDLHFSAVQRTNDSVNASNFGQIATSVQPYPAESSNVSNQFQAFYCEKKSLAPANTTYCVDIGANVSLARERSQTLLYDPWQLAPEPPASFHSGLHKTKKSKRSDSLHLIDFDDDSSDLLQAFDPLMAASSSQRKEPLFEKVAPQSSFEDDFVTPSSVTEKQKPSSPPPRPPRPVLPRQIQPTLRVRHAAKTEDRVYEPLRVIQVERKQDAVLRCFIDKVLMLRKGFYYNDTMTNAGFVISPVIENINCGRTSVKLVVNTPLQPEQPLIFSCDIHTSIEHVISQILCLILDDITGYSTDQYVLKVQSCAEFLARDSILADYEYVQICRRFDRDVCFTLLEISHLSQPLARSAKDDRQITWTDSPELLKKSNTVSYETIVILLETFEKEVEKFQAHMFKQKSEVLKVSGMVQAVKALCTMLNGLETNDISQAIDSLKEAAQERSLKSDVTNLHESGGKTIADTSRNSFLIFVIEQLQEAVRKLVSVYCNMFLPNFTIADIEVDHQGYKQITDMFDNLIICVLTLHRIPQSWKTSYTCFRLACGVFHGSRRLCADVWTKTAKVTSSFFDLIFFDEWLQFPSVSLYTLPRESRLVMKLYGIKIVPPDNKNEVEKQLQEVAGWVSLDLFDLENKLTNGPHLLGLWHDRSVEPVGPRASNLLEKNSSILHVELPEFGYDVVFPPVTETHTSVSRDYSLLNETMQQKIEEVLARDILTFCTLEENKLLWENRDYLYGVPGALPRLLQAVPGWNWASLPDIYCLLGQWKNSYPLTAIEALEFLLPHYADSEVRKVAVGWLQAISSDELCDYLPQLVQALKFERTEDSALGLFLLERSLSSIRVAHNLYWLLKQNADDERFRYRYELMQCALLCICGQQMREEFEHQLLLMEVLSEIADKVKQAKESIRMNVLVQELDVHLSPLLASKSVRLPLSPSLEVCGIALKNCFYFNSFTLPLKVAFNSTEHTAPAIHTIFKVGDDLRQDMLTMQIVHIMDKLWLLESLDLKLITFKCVATGKKQGLVELVSGAETLRIIQVEHGLTGSFKDRPIAEWLQKHNMTELDYQKAVENFTLSCAGFCVATYVLGIGDRHNDNIMLTHAGHMFHIDFGKFLGDAQKFGNIKRDRVPFVLTPDMAFVINGSDKPTSKFQRFVDLCCQSFNLLRKHGNLLLTLVSLLSMSGITGVSVESAKYVQRSLMLDCTDAEATVAFTRMIDESLKSWSTQINFFIHNLAQLRFSSDHSSGTILSFIPKTYSMKSDGKIASVEVSGFQKRYDPEKYYVYILKVTREYKTTPSFVFRRYREFAEFQAKLCVLFPLVKLPSLPKRTSVGRTQVKQVAEKRLVVIQEFLQALFSMTSEITRCDLVYTFFHPMLRDQEEYNISSLHRITTASEEHPPPGRVGGQVKISIRYHKDVLLVMIMHAKDLVSSDGKEPDPYIKLYLLPDPSKITKRKTKVAHKTFHPTYNEMIMYRLPFEIVKTRTLSVTVWSYDMVKENDFLGALYINLNSLDLSLDTTDWYELQSLAVA